MIVEYLTTGVCSDGQVWTTVWTSGCSVKLYGECNEWHYNTDSATGEAMFYHALNLLSVLLHCKYA